MYIDLNVPVPQIFNAVPTQSKKNKGKQPQQEAPPVVTFTPAQIASVESRIEVLEHLGYTVLGLNQTIQRKIDPKTHVNVLDPLFQKLKKRDRVTLVKRLTIVLDEESEKGFGLTSGNASIVAPYDIIALLPTTSTTFSQACLSHTIPSNLTAHIISLPLTLPRLPFNLKHTMVRTAIKNGAVFEISYVGALGGDADPAIGNIGGSEGGSGAKRNWWAATREIVRVSKGKGLIVTGGVTNAADLRAPRDVGNLITMLDLPQNIAHDAATKTSQSLILRAQTRRTYRAVLSEPRLVVPSQPDLSDDTVSAAATNDSSTAMVPNPSAPSTNVASVPALARETSAAPTLSSTNETVSSAATGNSRKHAREDDEAPRSAKSGDTSGKKKKKKHHT